MMDGASPVIEIAGKGTHMHHQLPITRKINLD